MKRFLAAVLSGVFLSVILTGSVFSQAAAGERMPIERLQEMKEQNQRLLEKQAATLQKLEEMAKEAEQLKFMSKRS